MLKHVWNLFAQAGSIWVAWVNENWLRGRSFWQILIPQSCSWSWKQILKLRELAKRLLRFKVGDGSRIFLWLDVWHPDGCLLEKYGHRAVYDAGSSLDAKLSTVIRNGDWFWPYARSDKLVELQIKLPEVDIGEVDLPVWHSRTGKYACVDTWDFLRTRAPRVKWWRVVWHMVAIPRHSFLLWLVFKDALITKEKMCKWGNEGDCLCLSCRGSIENRAHLFFQCGFSKRIWRSLMVLCLEHRSLETWEEITYWCITELSIDCFKTRLRILCLGAAVYNLWRQRNVLLHNSNVATEEALLSKIKWKIRARLLVKGNFKRTRENLKIAQLWNLPFL